MRRTPMPDLFALICAAIFGLLGLGFLVWAWLVSRRGRQSLGWPAAPGKIVSSGVRIRITKSDEGGEHTFYDPEIDYEYNVEGRIRYGSHIYVGGTPETADRAWAEGIVAKYPVGSNPRVFYDPAAPDYGVLERGSASRTVKSYVAWGIVSLVIATIAGWMI